MTGRVHSIQSLGTVDGPGIRYVVFLQGCNLRCKCCHNPDTWTYSEGKTYTSSEIVKNALRYKEYFGDKGGITFSGGEPLLQSDFVRETFELCKENGITTCIDTSGSIMNDSVESLLDFTDRVLLDIKYTNEKQYAENVGCSLSSVLDFLALLDRKKIPTTIRQVIIPSVNDSDENAVALKKIMDSHSCIDKIELLPFRKICQVKYDNLKIDFPFAKIPEPTSELMSHLNSFFK